MSKLRYNRQPVPLEIDLGLLAYLENALGSIDGAIEILDPAGKWLEHIVSAQNIRIGTAGITSPIEESGTGCLLFSDAVTNTVIGTFALPHNWDLDSVVVPFVTWSAVSAGAGDVVWQLETKVTNVGDAIPVSWTTQTITVASGGQDIIKLNLFSTMVLSSALRSANILWRLSRLGADGSDTLSGFGRLAQIGFRFRQDSIGAGSYTIAAT